MLRHGSFPSLVCRGDKADHQVLALPSNWPWTPPSQGGKCGFESRQRHQVAAVVSVIGVEAYGTPRAPASSYQYLTPKCEAFQRAAGASTHDAYGLRDWSGDGASKCSALAIRGGSGMTCMVLGDAAPLTGDGRAPLQELHRNKRSLWDFGGSTHNAVQKVVQQVPPVPGPVTREARRNNRGVS